MGGPRQHVEGRTQLDDAAGIHHGDPVADLAHHRHLVGDQHDGQAEALVDVACSRPGSSGSSRDRAPRSPRRTAASWARPRARGRCRRAASGRPTAWPATCPALSARPTSSSSGVTRARSRLRCSAREFERQGDIVEHAARGQQVEMLEDHADPAPRSRRSAADSAVRSRRRRDAARRAVQQVDRAQQRRLARAGPADHAEDLARRNRQVDIVQRLDPAPRSGKTLGDIAYFDHEKTKRRDCQRAWMRSRQAAAVTFIGF